MTESQKKKKQQEDAIDLLVLFKALLHRIWLLIIVAVLGGVLALAGTFLFITPKYDSSFTAYLNNHNSDDVLTTLSTSDLSARSTLANTAASIAKSNAVIDKVAEKFDMDSKQITINSSVDSSSSILTVQVVIEDKTKVASMAKYLSEVLSDETERIIEGSSLQIIDTPKEPESRYSPSYSKNAILGALICVIIAAIIICIITLQDDTLKNAADLQEKFGIPVIGSIPDLASAGKSGKGYGKSGYGYGYGGYGYSKGKGNIDSSMVRKSTNSLASDRKVTKVSKV